MVNINSVLKQELEKINLSVDELKKLEEQAKEISKILIFLLFLKMKKIQKSLEIF